MVSSSRSGRAAFSREDLRDLAVLAAVVDAGRGPARRHPRDLLNLSDREAWGRMRGLLERCQLVAAPRAPAGVRLGVIGQARLQRFVRSPIGSAAPEADLGEECALRLLVLDVIDPEDRDEILGCNCRDLVAMRDGVLTCALAESCRSGACPLAVQPSVEEIDHALLWLAAGLCAGQGSAEPPRGGGDGSVH